MIPVRPTDMAGCFEIHPKVHRDARGLLAKTFHATSFEALGMTTTWREIFYSTSVRGVIRGLHFQLPPADQVKMVTCVAGAVMDIVVDLRSGSPTFGGFHTCILDGSEISGIFVPVGLAHGFAVLSDEAVVAYAVSSEHDPERDAGIRWDSVPGLRWPIEVPKVSERDLALPTFQEFVSPFPFEAAVV